MNNVVAHLLDGQLVKGTTLDFEPGRPTCHVKTADRGMLEIHLSDLKALFFVKTLGGQPEQKRSTAVAPGDSRQRGAHAVELEFQDGERLAGLTAHYPPVRPFFFVLPADPSDNNIRILVNKAAVKAVHLPAVKAR